jgi:hypothetical protein
LSGFFVFLSRQIIFIQPPLRRTLLPNLLNQPAKGKTKRTQSNTKKGRNVFMLKNVLE